MVRPNTDTCAGCASFPTGDLATTGKTTCEWWSRVVTWDERACILHSRASDRAQRAALVTRLHQLQREGAP